MPTTFVSMSGSSPPRTSSVVETMLNAAMPMPHHGPSTRRMATNANARRDHEDHRVEDLLELRHAEGELAERRDEALQRQPRGDDVNAHRPARVVRLHAGVGEHEPRRDADEGRAEDHQHVRRAPHRDVDAELAVPQLVEREARDGGAAERQQRQRRPRDAHGLPPQRGVDALQRREQHADDARHAGSARGRRRCRCAAR